MNKSRQGGVWSSHFTLQKIILSPALCLVVAWFSAFSLIRSNCENLSCWLYHLHQGVYDSAKWSKNGLSLFSLLFSTSSVDFASFHYLWWEMFCIILVLNYFSFSTIGKYLLHGPVSIHCLKYLEFWLGRRLRGETESKYARFPCITFLMRSSSAYSIVV